MKKLLSLVLALSLVLGSFGMAFAAAPVDVTDAKVAAAVERLMALGIVDGYTDGTFRPAKVVTRAEMAKLLVVTVGLEDAVQYAGYTSSFSDVKTTDWYNAWVNVAVSEGLIKGYTDGTFKPANTVTYPEAITMLVRALGYKDENLTGTWPTNFIIKATKIGMVKDVAFNNGGANRGDIGILIDNTLFIDNVDADGKVVAGETLVKALVKTTNTVVTVEEITAKGVMDGANEVESAIDMASYLGDTVTVYTNSDDEIVYVASVGSKNMTVTVKANDVAANTITYAKDSKTDITVDYTDAVKVVWNGVAMTMAEVEAMDNFVGSEIKLVYTTTDKDPEDATFVVGASYQTPVMAPAAYEYDEDTVIADIDGIIATSLLTTTKDNVTTVDTVVTGDATSIDDIEAFDLLYVKKDDATGAVEIHVVRDSITGVIEEVKAGKAIVVDGSEIALGDNNQGNEAVAQLDANNDPIPNLIVLDVDGKVYDVTAVPGNAPATVDTLVGVVENVASITEVKDAWGNVTTEAAELVKVILTDGTEVTLNVASTVGFAAGQVVSYDNEADANGEYTLTIKALGADDASNVVAGKNLIDTTVVYMIDTTKGVKVTETAWSNVASLTDNSIAYYEFNGDFGDVTYIYVPKAAVTEKVTTDTTPVSVVIAKSSIIGGTKYTVLEDGVQKVYTSETVANLVVGNFYELTLTDGVITAKTDVTYAETDENVDAIDAARIKVDGTIYNFAKEVVVYDNTGSDFEVAAMADVVKDATVSVILDTDGNVATVVITDLP